jgi:hypothetical protein
MWARRSVNKTDFFRAFPQSVQPNYGLSPLFFRFTFLATEAVYCHLTTRRERNEIDIRR